MCIHVYIICLYVCIHVTYVCIYACMHVSMYVCTYVWMHNWHCMCVYTRIGDMWLRNNMLSFEFTRICACMRVPVSYIFEKYASILRKNTWKAVLQFQEIGNKNLHVALDNSKWYIYIYICMYIYFWKAANVHYDFFFLHFNYNFPLCHATFGPFCV